MSEIALTQILKTEKAVHILIMLKLRLDFFLKFNITTRKCQNLKRFLVMFHSRSLWDSKVHFEQASTQVSTLQCSRLHIILDFNILTNTQTIQSNISYKPLKPKIHTRKMDFYKIEQHLKFSIWVNELLELEYL